MPKQGTCCIYKTIQKATAVTDCVACKFTSQNADNLILAKGNNLEIYELTKQGGTELILNAQYTLSGTIESIVAGRFSPNVKDSLIISFPGYKIVVIDFDEARQNIMTTGLFDLRRGLNLPDGDYVKPEIRLDPQQRCVAVKISTSKVVILPLSTALLTTDDKKYKPVDPNPDADDEFAEEQIQTGGVSLFQDILVADLREVGINRIADFCFLHGYHAPELLVLYEANLTWAGRVAVKTNIKALRTISFNLPAKGWDVIHKANDLPFDTYKLVPIPEPIGGALVFSNDAIFHFGQNIDFGLTLNVFGDDLKKSTQYVLEELKAEVPSTLENVQCTFLSPTKVILGDFSGQLHQLTLMPDRRFEIEKIGYSDLTSCMCTLNQDYIFCGSRLGDSLLVKYEQQTTENKKREKEPLPEKNPKRRKLNNGEASPVADDELQELFSKSNPEKEAPVTVSYNFQMADAVGSVAPISDIALGYRIAESDAGTADSRKQIELVSCVGYGKNGSLAVARSGLHPNVMLSYGQLGAANGCWTLHCSPDLLDEKKIKKPKMDGDWHSFLITSHNDRTIVLSTEETLQEVSTDFYTKGPTFACGNVIGRKFMVQVYHKGIRILKDASKIEGRSDLLFESEVADAKICDPYVLIRLKSKEIRLYRLDSVTLEFLTVEFNDITAVLAEDINPKLQELDKVLVELVDLLKKGEDIKLKLEEVQKLREHYGEPDLPVQAEFIAIDQQLELLELTLQRGEPVDADLTFTLEKKCESYQEKMMKKIGDIVCFDFYKPNELTEDFIRSKTYKSGAQGSREYGKFPGTEVSVAAIPDKKMLDNDDMFFNIVFGGDKNDSDDENPEPVSAKKPDKPAAKKKSAEPEGKGEVLLTVVRSHGRIEIYELPQMRQVFFCDNFPSGTRILKNSLCEESTLEEKESVSAVEICLTTIRKNGRTPYLLSFLDTGDLLVYKLYLYDFPTDAQQDEPIDSPYLPIRMRRVSHEFITRPFQGFEEEEENIDDEDGVKKYTWFGGRRIVPFSRISGRSGVFIGGDSPGWVFGFRDFFRVHPMTTKIGVCALTEFHHANCENGMIWFTTDEDGCLKIGVLPMNHQHANDHAAYDCELVRQKVPMNHTAHKIVRHSETNTYVVVVVKKAEVPSLELKKKRSLPAFDDLYELRLYNPKTWKEFYSYNEFYFLQDEEDVFEHILALEEVFLKTPMTTTGKEVMKSYIACGTGTNRGESYTCQGRIFLWRVRESQETKVVGEGQLERVRRFDMELVFRRKERGPITAVCSVQGLLCIACGSKIMLYKWSGDTLIPCAFHNGDTYTLGLRSIKNYILISDVFNSISLVMWENDTLQVVLLGEDDSAICVQNAEFLADGEDLHLVVTDDSGCIQIYSYEPSQQISLTGKKLLRKADIHIGTRIHSLVQVGMQTMYEHSARRYMNLCGAQDGSLSYLAPIEEAAYKRLSSLHALMTLWTRQPCGLNPREFRNATNRKLTKTRNPISSILDGDVLWRYLSLSLSEQRRMARNIGSTPQQLIANLQSISLLTKLY